jgi:hypothetical protein
MKTMEKGTSGPTSWKAKCRPGDMHRGWGLTFVLTAYLLLITEAIGTYVGVHFLWIAKESSNKDVKVRFR